jgi:hypothetical protein
VAYSLEFDKDCVLSYFRSHVVLSREARVRLFTLLNEDLRERADFYLNDQQRRLAPGSEYFWFDLILRDQQGDGRLHRFWFVVNAAPAKYGILRIEYVEEEGPA